MERVLANEGAKSYWRLKRRDFIFFFFLGHHFRLNSLPKSCSLIRNHYGPKFKKTTPKKKTEGMFSFLNKNRRLDDIIIDIPKRRRERW